MKSLRRLIDPSEDFETDIVMNADLTDLRYLYRYGVYIGENEKQIAAFLNKMTDEEIQAMADTYTEGYRIGFEVTGKDLSKKQTVQLRYPIGFERMVRAAVHNFEKMNLKPTMLATATSPNKQFDYDHRKTVRFIWIKHMWNAVWRQEKLFRGREKWRQVMQARQLLKCSGRTVFTGK